jgi:hypothetical protein
VFDLVRRSFEPACPLCVLISEQMPLNNKSVSLLQNHKGCRTFSLKPVGPLSFSLVLSALALDWFGLCGLCFCCSIHLKTGHAIEKRWKIVHVTVKRSNYLHRHAEFQFMSHFSEPFFPRTPNATPNLKTCIASGHEKLEFCDGVSVKSTSSTPAATIGLRFLRKVWLLEKLPPPIDA